MKDGTDIHTLATALDAIGVRYDVSHNLVSTCLTIGDKYDGGMMFVFVDRFAHYEVLNAPTGDGDG